MQQKIFYVFCNIMLQYTDAGTREILIFPGWPEEYLIFVLVVAIYSD